MVSIISMLAASVLFVVLGIVFSFGKGAFLIAGYNTASKAKKETYDEGALCRAMGKAMFSLTAATLMWALSEALAIPWLFSVGLLLFFSTIVFMVLYANFSKKIRKS